MSLVDASEMMRDDVFYGSFNGTESSFFNRAKARLAPEQLDTEPVRPTITIGFGRLALLARADKKHRRR